MIRRTIQENKPIQLQKRNPKMKQQILYVNATAVPRTNAELDKHSKGSKKANPVPENQLESSERQPADKKGLKTVVKGCSNPHSSS